MFLLQSKLMATCQSSVELINHLSMLLIEESHVSEEYARAREVRDLSARYEQLLSQARAREQRMREARFVILSHCFMYMLLVLCKASVFACVIAKIEYDY